MTEKQKKRYALHPGLVTSSSDGDRHYIGVGQLARLYQLRPDEYIVWDDQLNKMDLYGRLWGDYIHLYPRYDGNYGRPNG